MKHRNFIAILGIFILLQFSSCSKIKDLIFGESSSAKKQSKNVINIDINTLLNEISINSVKTEQQYKNKTIRTSGRVDSISSNFVLAVSGNNERDWLFVELNESEKNKVLNIQKGQIITFSGVYDSGAFNGIRRAIIETWYTESVPATQAPPSPSATASSSQNDFQATHRVVTNDRSNLRLRNAQGFNSAQIGSLEYGTYVKVLNTGESAFDSDGNQGEWTYIITPDGRTGWCFGAYLLEY
jgi:hypothetical protein